jgi:hypothetical protein
MATVLGCNAEKQRPVVRFLRANGLSANDIHNEMFPVYDGSVCRVKRFTNGWQKFR